jgi:demethylmenaquinone methyltransferase/2-methoxy-6-polyprenyl-1,4-benzoquinol methylase
VPGPGAAGTGTVRAEPGQPNRFAQQLFTGLPARYDLLAELLSFGQNGRWRRAMVDRAVSAAPGRILDVATGTAGVALQLSRRWSGRVVGIDLTEAMLRRGRENVVRAGAGAVGRVDLAVGRAEDLPFPDATFDGLTFTYLLRYVADPAATLAELARVVKPGGPVASLEFHVPPSRFWRAWWWLYTRGVLPAAGGLAGRSWFEVGRFLGPSISGHYRRFPLDWTVEAWQEAGLVDVGYRIMSLGGGLVMWGRKGARGTGGPRND